MKNLFILFSTFLFFNLSAQDFTVQTPIRYLALGDSYTIGQSVSYQERWPTQLYDSLKSLGYPTDTLVYIATTGWRTDNLKNGITAKNLPDSFNMVSLLIGVNNQFQGKPFSQYKKEFPELLKTAISLANDNKSQVFVVSIPDYGYTPFNASSTTSDELDEYNNYAKHICDSIGVRYYFITDISRKGLDEPDLVANDGLHPSGKQYGEWVDRILNQGIVSSSHNELKIEKVLVYPNPTRGPIKLNTFSTWEITNSLGNKSLNGEGTEIDLSQFEQGIYYLRVKNNQIIKILKK